MNVQADTWVDPNSLLTVLAHFHPTSQSGIKFPLKAGVRCPCFPDLDPASGGFTAVFAFQGDVWPGHEVKAVLQFVLGEEAVKAVSRANTFYLGHGGYAGWARILHDEPIPRLRKGWASATA